MADGDGDERRDVKLKMQKQADMAVSLHITQFPVNSIK